MSHSGSNISDRGESSSSSSSGSSWSMLSSDGMSPKAMKVVMETVRETREDPLVREYFSKCKWSRILNFGLNNIYIFDRGWLGI